MLLSLFLLSPSLQAAEGGDSPTAVRDDGNAAVGRKLSRRAQKRYEDVLTTDDGSRWRGKIVEKGDIYRIRLSDGSVVAIPKDEVAAVTRELDPGYPHSGQWGVRFTLGGETGIHVGTEDAGLRYGALTGITLSRSFGGLVEPEIQILLAPFGETAEGNDQGYGAQIALGTRVYFQHDRKGKPFTDTHLVITGSEGDLGLRTGPGFQYDFGPNLGISYLFGFTALSQRVEDKDALALGFHTAVETQLRF